MDDEDVGWCLVLAFAVVPAQAEDKKPKVAKKKVVPSYVRALSPFDENTDFAVTCVDSRNHHARYALAPDHTAASADATQRRSVSEIDFRERERKTGA